MYTRRLEQNLTALPQESVEQFCFQSSQSTLRELVAVLGSKSKRPEDLCVARVIANAFTEHDDVTEFRMKACTAGPQGGEPLKCQY